MLKECPTVATFLSAHSHRCGVCTPGCLHKDNHRNCIVKSSHVFNHYRHSKWRIREAQNIVNATISASHTHSPIITPNDETTQNPGFKELLYVATIHGNDDSLRQRDCFRGSTYWQNYEQCYMRLAHAHSSFLAASSRFCYI
jgi:hypothetical protein